ncbi:MAG: hypothetical protein OXN89_12255 [Bryobacterales bacterium]|nr:hypothetical protein [Bryobacterales bacterium]
MIRKTYPIILAHGFARFDVISNGLLKIDNNAGQDSLHYFRNIRSFLMRDGFEVLHSNVDWAGSLAKRAADLKGEVDTALQRCEAEKVHIIGHSMGGLDARRMLFDFQDEDFHKKVVSVTTIGTPHHGSPVAEHLLKYFPGQVKAFGMALDGLKDLTPRATKEFNQEVESFEKSCGVKFRAYAGQQSLSRVFTPLKLCWAIINKAEGDNDGLASVASARWNDQYFVPPVWNADHLNQVGWWDLSELREGVGPTEIETRIKHRYVEIARTLAAEFPCH